MCGLFWNSRTYSKHKIHLIWPNLWYNVHFYRRTNWLSYPIKSCLLYLTFMAAFARTFHQYSLCHSLCTNSYSLHTISLVYLLFCATLHRLLQQLSSDVVVDSRYWHVWLQTNNMSDIFDIDFAKTT